MLLYYLITINSLVLCESIGFLFLLIRLFLHLLGASRTDALVVELLLLHDIAINHLALCYLWCRLIEEVNDLAAVLAVEVNVWLDVAIIAYVMLVDGDHLGCIYLTQQAKRVIHCGTAQGRYLVLQCAVNVFNVRVGRMLDQVVQDCQSLY